MKYFDCLVDTHCHLTDKLYKNNEMSKMMREIQNLGVKKCIFVGVDFDDSCAALNLASTYENMYASFGVHPNLCKNGVFFTEIQKKFIFNLKDNKNFVAVGETGLDRHNPLTDKQFEEQIRGFEQQIKLAIELDRPIIVHTRDAHQQTLEILRKYPEVRGVIHTFDGSFKIAKQYMDLGFYISFSGTCTFTNSHQLQEVIKHMPVEKMLIETDSPYLTPHPYRGQKNYPWFLKLVSAHIASVKKMDESELIRLLYLNAERLFKFR